MASTDSDTQSQLLRTALSIIQGYNNWSLDDIMAPRAPECTQTVFPSRMNQPSRTNEEYRAYFGNFMKVFENFHLEVLDVTEDAKRHKVSVHIRGSADTPLGKYGNEYIVITHMTEDDLKVKRIVEFVDSGYSADFFGRLRVLMESGKN